MNKATKDKLDYYNELYPGFKVQRFIDFPCPWISYNSPDYENYVATYGDPNHREILPDEIVIDVDAENTKHGKIHADIVQERLDAKGFNYKRYVSGGDGEHFHLIFSSLDLIFPNMNIEDVKYGLIEFMLEGLINPEDLDSHICLFKKKLIQIEDAPHRKGKKKLLRSRRKGINIIPDEFFTFYAYKLSQREAITSRISSIKQPDNLNCIRYFYGENINGENYFDLKRINYRTLFSIASYYHNKYKNTKEVKEKVMEWYNSIPLQLRRDSVGTVNLRQIDILSKRSNGTAGCLYRLSLLEELGKEKKICESCPYYVKVTE